MLHIHLDKMAAPLQRHFRSIFLKENIFILIQNALKFVPNYHRVAIGSCDGFVPYMGPFY